MDPSVIIEVGTRGFINDKNKNILTQLCHSLRITKVSSVVKNCSKLALLGSFTIWNARYSSDWNVLTERETKILRAI